MLKKSFITLAVALISLSLSAQYYDLSPDQNEKGKWGYIDDNGTLVIKYQYDEAEGFINGRAKVKKGDNYGFIDPSGKEIVKIKYRLIEPFLGHPGKFKVAVGGKVDDGMLEGEKYGYITENDEVLIKPEYEEITQFTNGLARLCKGNKYGFMDENFNIVIPVKYTAVGAFNEEGMVWVNIGGKPSKDDQTTIKGGKFGIFNSEGKVIIPVEYKTIGTFSPWRTPFSDDFLKKQTYADRKNYELTGRPYYITRTTFKAEHGFVMPSHYGFGYWMSKSEKMEKNGVVDKDGNVIWPAGGKYRVAFFPTEGLMPVCGKKDNEYGYVDLATSKLIGNKYQFTSACNFQDGVAVVYRNYAYYLINRNMENVAGPFTMIFPKKDGVYVTKNRNQHYGLLDSKGNQIFGTILPTLIAPSEGLILYQLLPEGQYGYKDTKGETVIEPQYKLARPFINGYANVQTQNGWGTIAPDGSEVVEPVWNDIYLTYQYRPRYIWVQKSDGMAYCYDTQNKRLKFPKGYKNFRNFGRDYEGVALVERDGLSGLIDEDGNEIIPCQLKNWVQVRKGYNRILSGEIDRWKPIHTYYEVLRDNPNRNRQSLTSTISNDLWDF